MTDFKLRKPCKLCPFRTDVHGYLRRARAIEIVESLGHGAPFPCHKTTDLDEGMDEETGTYYAQGGEQFCAGALIMLEHQEAPNQMMRVAENLGVYDASKLDMEAPVHRTTVDFVNHHDDADGDEEADCCEVCGPNCEAPAGYLVGGVVVPADNDLVELHECPECGMPVCAGCSNENGVCENCAEWEAA